MMQQAEGLKAHKAGSSVEQGSRSSSNRPSNRQVLTSTQALSLCVSSLVLGVWQPSVSEPGLIVRAT